MKLKTLLIAATALASTFANASDNPTLDMMNFGLCVAYADAQGLDTASYKAAIRVASKDDATTAAMLNYGYGKGVGYLQAFKEMQQADDETMKDVARVFAGKVHCDDVLGGK